MYYSEIWSEIHQFVVEIVGVMLILFFDVFVRQIRRKWIVVTLFAFMLRSAFLFQSFKMYLRGLLARHHLERVEGVVLSIFGTTVPIGCERTGSATDDFDAYLASSKRGLPMRPVRFVTPCHLARNSVQGFEMVGAMFFFIF